MNRQEKRVGGVALYTENRLNYKVLESMTTTTDGLMECITVEVCIEKQKMLMLLICSCVYRVPGSSTEKFKDSMDVLFASTGQKVTFT